MRQPSPTTDGVGDGTTPGMGPEAMHEGPHEPTFQHRSPQSHTIQHGTWLPPSYHSRVVERVQLFSQSAEFINSNFFTYGIRPPLLLLPWALQRLGAALAEQSKSATWTLFILTATEVAIPREVPEHMRIIFTCLNRIDPTLRALFSESIQISSEFQNHLFLPRVCWGRGFQGWQGLVRVGWFHSTPNSSTKSGTLAAFFFFFFLVITITLAGFFFPNAYKNMTLLCSVFCKEQDTDFTVFTSAGVN